ncbi:hypothetical protein BO94DRAFT_614186 [Aspergillus sclerotioniger CBS 115572]|uniref:Uncharacterized protein n=1 Tax=Aspergillus sclerotioniger CBS 115572 TaxID=1450535 RepID=A0A317UXG5_9EURO|nr:hypothetical protein BO94DRAFT_614186 [Aspergillus sclerotioniger CBS 115572]PWY65678.1 hypothetical protein BO94DRAFT_614186 [Aspergillus sclerotioniger CBS 115572]
MDNWRRSINEPAAKTLNENTWLRSINGTEDAVHQFRNIQNTYHVQLGELPNAQYGNDIWLLWDYDRIWGKFDFGYTTGLFLVDSGPRLSDDGIYLPFCWRGARESSPNDLIWNKNFTKGRICIDPKMGTLKGSFQYMKGNGDAGAGTCEFHAKARAGPAVVPFRLENVVDEWNAASEYMGALEGVRQDMSVLDLEGYLCRKERDGRRLGV